MDEVQFKISQVLSSMRSLLEHKNEKYGNAALEPLNIFAKSGNGIEVRIDDKLQRVKNRDENEPLRKNDVSDLIGYLTLLCVQNDWINFDEFKD